MDKPLDGVRVLDFTHVLAGPFCTMFLGAMGAEIIKVERPGLGDIVRQTDHILINGESTYFMHVNANKKSVTLNLRHEKGKEIVKELAKKVDVVLENFSPGTMKRLGLDYESLRQVNPRIIYGSNSGFGQYGPLSHRPAYDPVTQGAGGLISLNGFPERMCKVGPAINDLVSGLYLALGVLLALRYRDVTGKGQSIDVSMQDAAFSLLERFMIEYFTTGNVPKRIGSRFIHKATDGYVVIAASTDQHWVDLTRVMGREDLARDPRLSTAPRRRENPELVESLIEEWTVTKSASEIVSLLDEASVPCGPVNDLAACLNDPQLQAREMVVWVDHPIAGRIPVLGVVPKLSESPGSVVGPAPTLGQNNEEIYGGLLGYSKDEIARLRQEGVV